MGELGAAARNWVSERTDYPRHVAQLALAHEADGGVINVDFDWRPKNNVSNYASAEGTANERQALSAPARAASASGSESGNRQRDANVAHWQILLQKSKIEQP
jgi:hypothetical protein